MTSFSIMTSYMLINETAGPKLFCTKRLRIDFVTVYLKVINFYNKIGTLPKYLNPKLLFDLVKHFLGKR